MALPLRVAKKDMIVTTGEVYSNQFVVADLW